MAIEQAGDRPAYPLTWAAGVASITVGAGLGELTAGVIAPESSPFAVVGDALVDAAPVWAKDAAIALFGTADKIALFVGIAIVALALAALAGWLQSRTPPWGLVVVGAFGATGVVAAMTRADAGPVAWLPSLVAGVAAAIALHLLTGLLTPPPRASSAPPVVSQRSPAGASAAAKATATGDQHPDRRTFFIWAGVATAGGVIATIAGSAVRAGSRTVTAARQAIGLPAASVPAAAVPASAELGISGLAPVITPNAEFYRIDTALIVPQVDTSDWSLRIYGMVKQEVTITWDELVALPLEESYTTLSCVSNSVGGDLIGNAKWLGYPIRELLARAEPTADADMVLSQSIDGFTASTPLSVLTDDRDSILAIGMNDEPLPIEHGFPVRMVVPGLYGYVSATKWVTELKVTTFEQDKAYWSTRGWTERGPIKLQSRIDVPSRNQSVVAGETVIAGVAWQPHVGVSKVEVQIDGGEWLEATLATAISDDTWVQWSMPWTATSGSHTISCRATNVNGETQTDAIAPPAPDGATGWQQISINVA
ncbi:molybdopterin-dependent oxidoreductase [Microbacterium sp. NPDC076911]|uniref:molybdopterin-dependent oxidoreductase n=1 Tax=Microbacterium sp. NPDC076911 TaxID=3154958 RepID=UPI00342CCEF5